MTRLKTECNKMAREAVLQGDRYLGQKNYRGAFVFYLKASQLGSKEGNKKCRQMQELLGDSDLVNPEQYAKNQKRNQVALETPKIQPSFSIPTEENRKLIEDRSKLQHKVDVSQKETNKQQRAKDKPNTTCNRDTMPQSSDVLSSWSEKAEAGDVVAQVQLAKELRKQGKKKDSNGWWKKAADNGNPDAKAKVGQWYLERAFKYLGKKAVLRQLEEKITSQHVINKTEEGVAPKQHFRHQRNRIAELSGCGDTEGTETSVLHSVKVVKKTWVGKEKKDKSPLPPQVIIQELVRYVNYWSGNDCLPTMIRVDRQEPVSCECYLPTGHEFSAEPIIWREDFADEPCWRHIFTLIFRKLFSIFYK